MITINLYCFSVIFTTNIAEVKYNIKYNPQRKHMVKDLQMVTSLIINDFSMIPNYVYSL